MRAASCLLKSVLLTSSLPVIAACSNQRAYNFIQESRWQACAEQPIPLQAGCQAGCQARHETPFAEYMRLRNAAAATDRLPSPPIERIATSLANHLGNVAIAFEATTPACYRIILHIYRRNTAIIRALNTRTEIDP